MECKTKKIVIISAIIIGIVLIASIVLWVQRDSKVKEPKRNLEEERKTVLKIAKERVQLDDNGTHTYDVSIEKELENGTYNVRLYEADEKTPFYYNINPKTKESIFIMEKKGIENEQSR